jgi:hypothetical protein
MGKTKCAAVNSGWLWPILALTIASCAHPTSIASDTPTDLVIQFLTNAHTGKPMDASDWLQREAREAKQFQAFGGLDALVKQSTSFAHDYGGLKSVEILNVKAQPNGYEVVAEVKFFDDAKRRKSPTAAEREDMRWTFRVVREEARWMLSY